MSAHPDDAILRIKRVRDSFGLAEPGNVPPGRPGLKETKDAIETCDWDEDRARALLIERGHAKEPAKGCHGCANNLGHPYCDALFGGRPNREPVRAWSNVHLEDNQMTPKPGAPECPGRVER